MYDNLDSFERMAASISDKERRELFEQIRNSTQQHEDEEFSPVETSEQTESIPITDLIKKESLVFRFFVWIKSLILSTTKETVYNEYKINLLSKNVTKNYPGLIDMKRGVFLASFYNKLNELQSAAQFLRPYVSEVDEDENSFYMILSSVLLPETDARINTEVNPYSNPISASSRPELRMEFIRKLENIFDSIPSSDKSKMYEAAKAVDWLRSFVKIPFTRFLSAFSTDPDDIYVCSYDAIGNDISILARCLCNGFIVSDELIESLYLFSKRRKVLKNQPEEGEASQFIDRARASMSLVHMFMTSVPLKSLGCIVANDMYWQIEPFSGGEDWFVRYKAACKRSFEKKWEQWVKDCQIESLKINLRSNFGIDDFPSLPDRPWTRLWGGQRFKYELTAGFFYWFMVERFSDFEIALKTVMVEGDFMNKTNQATFADAFNSMIQISISLQNLQMRCSPTGETGMMLKKFSDEHLRTLNAQAKVEQLIRGIESDFDSILHRFGGASRSLSAILSGILGLDKSTRADSLANLNTLHGKDNERFKQDLLNAKNSLENALNLIKELETLDNKKIRA